MIMYVAVTKPERPDAAAPAGYAVMPACCRYDAANSTTPHVTPATTSIFLV